MNSYSPIVHGGEKSPLPGAATSREYSAAPGLPIRGEHNNGYKTKEQEHITKEEVSTQGVQHPTAAPSHSRKSHTNQILGEKPIGSDCGTDAGVSELDDNHSTRGAQMELEEIEKIRKRTIREIKRNVKNAVRLEEHIEAMTKERTILEQLSSDRVFLASYSVAITEAKQQLRYVQEEIGRLMTKGYRQ